MVSGTKKFIVKLIVKLTMHMQNHSFRIYRKSLTKISMIHAATLDTDRLLCCITCQIVHLHIFS